MQLRELVRSFPLPAMVMLWFMAAAPGAGQIATATVSGSIRDETGAALPGSTITVKNIATSVTRGTTSDAEGRYRVSALEPGEYEVRAERGGFKTAVQKGVVLTVGGST